jgi:hypothetical protein
MMCGAYIAISPKLQHELKTPNQLNIPDPNSWNVTHIVDSLKQLVTLLHATSFTSTNFSLTYCLVVNHQYPNINWRRVLQCLDYPQFRIPDQRGLSLLVNAYEHATKVNLL